MAAAPKTPPGVRWLSKGLYEVTVALGRDPRSPATAPRYLRKRVRVAARSVAEAVKAREELKASLRSRRGRTATTVEELLADYVADAVRAGRSATTILRYQGIAKAWVEELGPVRLVDLTVPMVERTLSRWGERLSLQTVLHHRAVLRAAWERADDWGWVEGKNPAGKAVRLPTVVPVTTRPPTDDELRRLFEVAAEKDPGFVAALALAAGVGLRRGEIAALTWSRVDWERGSILVDRSVTALSVGTDGRVKAGAPRLKDTKTHAASSVTVPAVVLAVLQAEHDRRAELCQAGGISPAADGHVVTARRDFAGRAPADPGWLSHRFEKIRRAAGVEGVRLHDLRHWSGTVAGDVANLRDVMAHLRHSQIATSMRYVHSPASSTIAEEVGRRLPVGPIEVSSDV